MPPVPARRRPTLVSLLSGVLAMSASLAVLGALALSDAAAAAANTPPGGAPGVQQPPVTVESAPAPLIPSELERLAKEESQVKPPVKRARKRAKVDFGRFEGY